MTTRLQQWIVSSQRCVRRAMSSVRNTAQICGEAFGDLVGGFGPDEWPAVLNRRRPEHTATAGVQPQLTPRVATQAPLRGGYEVSGWLGLAVLVIGTAAGITVPLAFHVTHWLTAVVLLAILVVLVSEGTYRAWSEVDAEREAAVAQADSERTEVLKLQSDELKALAADRMREVKDQRSEQARHVQMWEERHEQDPRVLPTGERDARALQRSGFCQEWQLKSDL